MKRIALIVFSLLAIGVATAGAAAGTAAPPRASLRSFTCVTAMDPASRAVAVTAVMRPMPQTKRMQLKFELLSRSGRASPWIRLRGGDLNKWKSPSDPTLGQQPGDVWNLIKQVIRLKAPATYRFHVLFRWVGPHGRVLGTAARTSAGCFQPELRPDLQVRTINVEAVPGQPNANAYVAVIHNNGASATGPFEVQFTDGQVDKTRSVASVAAHATIRERFVGPLCTAGTATVTADPADQVDDLNRANNSLNVVCSASAGARLHRHVFRSP